MSTVQEQPASIADEIKKHRDEEAAAAERAYWAMVREAAIGKLSDYRAAAKLLDSAHKTDRDLSADVEHIKARIKLAEVHAAAPKIRAALVGFDEKIAAANEKLEQAKREHRAAVEPLSAERDTLASRLSTAETAGDDLIRNCRDGQIALAEKVLFKEVRALENERKAIESELGVGRMGSPGWHRAALVQQISDRADSPANKKFLPTAVDGFQKNKRPLRELQAELASLEENAIKPRRARLAEIAAQRVKLDAKQAALSAAKLVP